MASPDTNNGRALNAEWRERLSAYHDYRNGDRTALHLDEVREVERAMRAGSLGPAIELHLASLARLDGALDVVPTLEPSSSLKAGFWARLADEKRRVGRVLRLHRRAAIASTAAVVLVALGVFILLAIPEPGDNGAHANSANSAGGSSNGASGRTNGSVPDNVFDIPEPDPEMLATLDLLASEYDLRTLAEADLRPEDIEVLTADPEYLEALANYDSPGR